MRKSPLTAAFGAVFSCLVLVGSAATVLAEAPPTAVTRPATPSCDFRDTILEFLERRYQETPVALGITSGGGLVEVLTTDDGKTWTIIVTRPDGWACLVAAGDDWQRRESTKGGEGL